LITRYKEKKQNNRVIHFQSELKTIRLTTNQKQQQIIQKNKQTNKQATTLSHLLLSFLAPLTHLNLNQIINI
jgi:uncharacterized surface protein with fasciclin (FAS1) repeats